VAGAGGPGEPAPAETAAAEAILAGAVAAYQRALGSRLTAAYALGSLAHGGFSPLVSDVDLGLILAARRPADRLTVRRVAAAVRETPALDPALRERLSVFWGTPASLRSGRGGRFPPLDRLDLLEYGRLLAGQDARAGLPRPGPAELVVAGARFALAQLPPEEARAPAALAGRGPRRVTKVVLFPVRFLYTARTGRVGTNDAAVKHYLTGGGPAAELVAAAMTWRQRPAPADVTTALLARDLIPLYVHYLDDHIPRLEKTGHQLAARFRRWRAALLA
jgi:hypothetical protein